MTNRTTTKVAKEYRNVYANHMNLIAAYDRGDIEFKTLKGSADHLAILKAEFFEVKRFGKLAY